MKNIVTYLLALLIFAFNFCNNEDKAEPKNEIQNTNFESWSFENEFDKPLGWNTSNFSLYSVVSFNTVSKDSLTAYEGKYCPRLETKSQIIGDETVKVVGLITLGNFDINIATKEASISGGIPFKSKPMSLEGYYKYNAIGSDKCYIDIVLTKTLDNKNQDTIARGTFSSESTSEWVSFEIPLQYYLNEEPENLNIVILSSDTSIFENGSTLWVDNLSLKY